jgi:hypothetical protein
MEPYILEVSQGRFVNFALATEINAMTRMAKVCYVGSTAPVTYTEEESDVLRKALGRMKHEP